MKLGAAELDLLRLVGEIETQDKKSYYFLLLVLFFNKIT
jgi:hypothetical protein